MKPQIKTETLYVDGFARVVVGGPHPALVTQDLLSQVSRWQTKDPEIDVCIEQQLNDGTLRVSRLVGDCEWSEWEHQDCYGNPLDERSEDSDIEEVEA